MATRRSCEAALALCLVLVTACAPGQERAASDRHRTDLVVFAAHPDDEVIGAGGVIRQAAASGKRVLVVFVTNGDGYPKAAAALDHLNISALQPRDYDLLAAARQREAMAADQILGLTRSDLVFLGYPDGVLASVYAEASSDAVQSPTTGRTATYGPVATDYHTLQHGAPAPYTRAAALADIEEILSAALPARVLVTGPADLHPDHRATFELVRDAVVGTGFRGDLQTFIVHSGAGWPSPIGPTPGVPFTSRQIGSQTYPLGVSWPPPIRIELSALDSALKRRAIEANRTELAYPDDRLFLESFVKSDEVFWIAPVG